MSCQGPDGLKVICRLPDLVNVFELLAQSVREIETSGFFADNHKYVEGFHVLYRLAKRIAKRLNNLSERLNKYRDYLLVLINDEATVKTGSGLMQKVTTVLQELRQEMSKLAPKLHSAKSAAREVSNVQSVTQIRNTEAKEAELNLEATRAEEPLYRQVGPSDNDLLEPQKKLDMASLNLKELQRLFQRFHIIARVDPSMMKLKQDIGDFLTEILLLFQEEIVELEMLIRLCQQPVTASEKDKDRKMLEALVAVKKYMDVAENDDHESTEIQVEQADCVPTIQNSKAITNALLDNPKLIVNYF